MFQNHWNNAALFSGTIKISSSFNYFDYKGYVYDTTIKWFVIKIIQIKRFHNTFKPKYFKSLPVHLSIIRVPLRTLSLLNYYLALESHRTDQVIVRDMYERRVPIRISQPSERAAWYGCSLGKLSGLERKILFALTKKVTISGGLKKVKAWVFLSREVEDRFPQFRTVVSEIAQEKWLAFKVKWYR